MTDKDMTTTEDFMLDGTRRAKLIDFICSRVFEGGKMVRVLSHMEAGSGGLCAASSRERACVRGSD